MAARKTKAKTKPDAADDAILEDVTPAVEVDPKTHKTCETCGEPKLIGDFRPYRHNPNELFPVCQDCRDAQVETGDQ